MGYLLGATTRRTPATERDPREHAELSEAMRMLGGTGALRLLKAFFAIPPNPARLRDSIVALVEGIAVAWSSNKNSRGRMGSARHSESAEQVDVV